MALVHNAVVGGRRKFRPVGGLAHPRRVFPEEAINCCTTVHISVCNNSVFQTCAA